MTNYFRQLTFAVFLRSVLLFILFSGCLISTVNAQKNDDSNRKPGLVFFNDQLVSTEKAIPHFENLAGRRLFSIPDLDFVAAHDIVIEFDARIRPDGTVNYVRSRRCNPEFNEYRKGALFALYNAKFNPDQGAEDQWVRVVYTFPGVH